MHYDIVVFGVKDTTVEVIKYIQESLQKKIDLMVTVSEKVTKNTDIAGYTNAEEVAESYGIHVFATDAYSLGNEKCKSFFTNNTFGIGISMGWQRLIPSSVLDRFNAGVYGFHGSCGYLPFGRGRSPLNWSVLLGDKRFILNLFRYDEKADSPNVFKNVMFEINEHDTIRTLQYKNILCSRNLIRDLLEAFKTNSIATNTESVDFDSWYIKRNSEDGKIDFKHRTRKIYNLIRAVSKPFPGAYCFLGDKKIIIWDAVPFDSIIDFSKHAVGEVIDVFDDKPLIRTIDGSLLIRKFESDVKLKVRQQLK